MGGVVFPALGRRVRHRERRGEQPGSDCGLEMIENGEAISIPKGKRVVQLDSLWRGWLKARVPGYRRPLYFAIGLLSCQ